MPEAYKCSDCKTVYDTEEQACTCEAKHNAPDYIRAGGTLMRKGQSMYVDVDDDGYELSCNRVVYYRDAGQWELDFTIRDGKVIAVGNGPTEHLDGVELIPCSGKEYREDNRGYV